MTIADGRNWPATLAAAQRTLAREFGIRHVTLQPTWPGLIPEGRVIPVVAAPPSDRRSSNGGQ